MKLVRHVLESKGSGVISVPPSASVLEAIKLMAEKGIGALVVMEGGDLKGIVTERDYARKVILKDKSSRSTPIGEIMTVNLHTAAPDDTVDRCMNTMTDERIRHLPVVHAGEVVGMISIGDLVKAVIADQREAIEQLEHYITG
jgi:CBS domain-containing protein